MKRSNAVSKPNIKFSEIRPLEGKQDKGFEELCVQLLPMLVGERILRIDRIEGRGGDGGVEAIALTASGQHVGLQSKFFSKLDATQWRQVDESVKTAIDKHPELTRYIVCVPLDRTPGQLKKWTALVASWRALNSTLVVDWIGYSELLGCLLKSEASHLLTYWFSCPQFSLNWVSKQTEIAIGQLHDRYTPQLHQPTSAEVRLEFLTASPMALAEHRKQCSDLVIVWRRVLRELPQEIKKLNTVADLTTLQAAFDAVLFFLHEGNLAEQRDELVSALGVLGEQAEQLVLALYPGEQKYPGPYWEFRRNSKLEDALAQTGQMKKTVERNVRAQRKPLWVLAGEAGTGKSHLLADLAQKLLTEGRVCLLMVGERFATSAVLAEQMSSLLHWDWSFGELLACMSTHAGITGQTAVLMVDAINESPDRSLWRRELPQLMALIQAYPGVRLLVSCRTDCLESSLPAAVQTEYNTIQHHGFDLQFHQNVQAYFDGYQVVSPQFPTLNPEFQNPLFLKTLCEAYQGKTLPLGHITFMGVLDAWEARVASHLERKIDCPKATTQLAINDIVRTLAKSEAKRIPADKANGICLRHFSDQRASHSLYRHLNSEGLLQEVETQDGTLVRLQYERFSDVRIAQMALRSFTSKPQWLVHWQATFLPSRMEGDFLDWGVGPELSAYALLLPNALALELVECPIGMVIREAWARSKAKEMLWNAWLDALPWRELSVSNPTIPRLFAIWANQVDRPNEVWERMFQFACIPSHPLNADHLHLHLNELDLPARELQWTVPLAKEDPTDQTDGSVVGPFFYWVDAAVGKASEEQVRLAAKALLWLTTSSNRELRDRATDVAIRVLAAHRQAGNICIHLLDSFWEVNDPYVKERLLAVMCGVLPCLNALNAKPIAEFVLRHFWQAEEVAPHILQREYAAFVVRHACATGVLPIAHLTLLARLPHKPKPAVWTEKQVDVYDKDSAYWDISSSLVPEEMGNYGDFGRYVMGSAVHHFADDERAEPTAKGMGRGGEVHDARFARRYIWQRVIELGWTPERFAEFERGLGYSGRIGNDKRIERISKKYQWIGLHEYLGHLSDSLLYLEWDVPPRPLRGAWELNERDYHPELALRRGQERDAWSESPPVWWKVDCPVPTFDSVEEKRSWVQSAFPSFEPYLNMDHEQRRWVLLHTHLNFNEDMGFGIERFTAAQMSQWIDVRALLIPKTQLSKRLKVLRRNFWGDGCNVPRVSQCWVSEFPWHPSFQAADEECLNNHTWFRGLKKDGFYLPVCEISDDHRHILLPAPSLHRDLCAVLGHPLSAPKLTTNGCMEIHDHTGRCIVKASAQKGTFLMIDEAVLKRYLEARNLTLVWAVLSEKSAWNGSKHVGGLANQSAIYVLENDGSVSGGLTVGSKEPHEE